MHRKNFDKHFDYGSFLPLLLFIFGIYILFLFLIGKYSQGFFTMLISFVIYITNNIIINIKGFATVFNEYLEDMAVFLTFGINTIIFGLIFYKNSLLVLTIVFFYATSLVLALSRNWVLKFKNSLGWPIALNGIFFPLIYYIYEFYLKGPGDSIFIVIYIVVAFLSTSSFNFLGYRENNLERFKVMDTKEFEKNKNLENEFEEEDSDEEDSNAENSNEEDSDDKNIKKPEFEKINPNNYKTRINKQNNPNNNNSSFEENQRKITDLIEELKKNKEI